MSFPIPYIDSIKIMTNDSDFPHTLSILRFKSDFCMETCYTISI